jgi:NADH-quinone oxidoreductase subunit L
MLKLVWLIPIFPLVGFFINFLLGKKLRLSETVVSIVACGVIGLSLLLTLGAFVDYKSNFNPQNEDKPYITSKEGSFGFTWMPGGRAHNTQGEEKGKLSNLNIEWSYQIDQLSLVMMFVVTFVGFLIHIFATGYMHGDPGFYRFFSYLNLFMFMMLLLVMGSNFMIMFVGWEGVGLCSYLLIGYYINKQEAGDASKKAFVVNRIGDFGFALAIFGIFATFGTLQFHDLAGMAKAYPQEALGAFGLMSWLALGLFIGATGKSAQIPLFIWLPDAMAGPTPVSALIHAATMVTAGVFMLTRTNFIFQRSLTMMMIVAIVGCLTAFVAATIGITQTDIKKVLAYSTVSQLGFMFLGAGAGAFIAAIFHVFTHAFFKALLFLGSGSVIHGMHHEQDMHKMGGLKKYMPKTYRTMWVAWLAICGIIPFAGFWSKDEILWKTFDTELFSIGKILWVIGFITAGITAFYMTRLMMLTFEGKERFRNTPQDSHGHDAHSAGGHDDGHGHHGAFEPHESPTSMTAPLVVLAVFSAFIGLIGIPHAFPALVGSHANINLFERWLEPVIEKVPAHGTALQHATTATAEAHGSTQTTASEAHNAAESAVSESHATTQTAHAEGQHQPVKAAEYILIILSLGIAGLGIYLGRLFYLKKPEMAQEWGAKLQPLYKLSFNKWYWDWLLDVKGVEAGKAVNNALWKVDSTVVDGGVNGAGALSRFGAKISNLWDKYVVDMLVNATGWISKGGSLVLRAFQTGFWQNYALVFVFGVLVIFVFYVYPAISATLKTIFGGK